MVIFRDHVSFATSAIFARVQILAAAQYLSRTANGICLAVQIIFVSHYKQYLSHTTNNICLTLQTIFVSHCKHIARRVCPTLSQTSRKIARNDLT